MQADRWRSWLIPPILGLAAAAGSIGCLTTGFEFAFPVRVLPVWIIWSALCVCCCHFRRGGTVLLCLTALALGWSWQIPAIRNQILTLVSRILTIYDNAYHWGIPPLPDFSPQTSLVYPLMMLGGLIVAAVTRTAGTRQGTPFVFLLTEFPLGMCLIVTDTVPDPLPLVLALTALGLLILTTSVRRDSIGQSHRLLLTALLPVLLCLVLLMRAFPKETYVNHSKSIQHRILNAVEKLPDKIQEQEFHLPDLFEGSAQVDLAALHGQQQTGLKEFTVTSRSGGTLYLRQQDYDRYTGKAWESTPGRREDFSGSGDPVDTVTIHMPTPRQTRCLPYYPETPITLVDGSWDNAPMEQEYTVACRSARVSAFPSSDLLALPEETARRAGAILNRIPSDFRSTELAAQAIGAYVQQTARYDLHTGAMPNKETDFAMWFLESADSGYCTHFATAAAVLLRSIGVPARYVTGYMVQTQPDVPTDVTSDDAHAWVEYFDYSTGLWHILEATPAAQEDAPAPSVSATIPTESTQPETQSAIRKDRQPLSNWWLLVLLIPAVPIQRSARLALRRRAQRTGTTNDQAIACWQETVLLSRVLKEPPPRQLRQLAEKAKFSQHQLTAEELHSFTVHRRQCQTILKKRPIHRRFLDKYIYCVW